MEAKDTLLEIPQGTEPQTELCRRCVYRRNQAEISFKAGIKEVVDWLDRVDIYTHYQERKAFEAQSFRLLKYCTFWQAKLKEWGIIENPVGSVDL